MAKLLVKPPLSTARALPKWEKTTEYGAVNGMVWGPGYGVSFGSFGCLKKSSADGLTWTTVPNPFDKSLTVRHAIWTGSLWVFCVSGTTTIYWTPDLVVWSSAQVFVGAGRTVGSVAFDGTTYVANTWDHNTARVNFFVSTNLTTWKTKDSNAQGLVTLIRTANSFMTYGEYNGYSAINRLDDNITNMALNSVNSYGAASHSYSGSIHRAAVYGSWAVFTGNFNAYMYTTDGGYTRGHKVFPSTFSTDNNVKNVVAVGAAFVFYQTVYATTPQAVSYDGGATLVVNEVNQDYITHWCSDGSWIYANSAPWGYARSNDLGCSWEFLGTQYPLGSGASYRGPMTGVSRLTATVNFGLQITGGSNRQIFYTRDQGRTYKSANISLKATLADGGKIWECGPYLFVVITSFIYYSSDGATWYQITIASPSRFRTSRPIGIVTNGAYWLMFGHGGWIEYSGDLVNWVTATSFTTQAIGNISWDGSQFVAVSYLASTAVIATSPDGVTWTRRTLPAFGATTVTAAYPIWTGQRHLVPGTSGSILSSANGVTWTNIKLPMTPVTTHLASNGATVIAVSNAAPDKGTGACISYDHGLTWAPLTIPISVEITAIACQDGRWHIGAYIQHPVTLYSDDGVNWFSRPVNCPDIEFISLSEDKTALIGFNNRDAVSRGSVIISKDWGVTWTFNYTILVFKYIVQGKGLYVGYAGNNFYWSTDAVTWNLSLTLTASRTNNPYFVMDYNGTHFVAATGEPNRRRVSWSTDGKNWTTEDVPVSPYGGGTVAKFAGNVTLVGSGVGERHFVVSVDNGASWVAPSSTNLLTLTNVTDFVVGKSNYLVVGQQALYTSTDLVNWVSRPLPVNTFPVGAAFANNMFVAVANSDSLYSYDDGVTWNKVPFGYRIGTSQRLSVLWTGTMFISAENGGAILTLVPPPEPT